MYHRFEEMFPFTLIVSTHQISCSAHGVSLRGSHRLYTIQMCAALLTPEEPRDHNIYWKAEVSPRAHPGRYRNWTNIRIFAAVLTHTSARGSHSPTCRDVKTCPSHGTHDRVKIEQVAREHGIFCSSSLMRCKTSCSGITGVGTVYHQRPFSLHLQIAVTYLYWLGYEITTYSKCLEGKRIITFSIFTLENAL